MGRNVPALRTSYSVKPDEDMTPFDELYAMYHTHVYRFARALADDARDAEDLILWGAVLIWVYRDAEKRGMSGILWLLLVLIGNVIGLLIYAIVRSETPVKQRAGGAGGSAGPEKCPGCGNPVSPGHSFCPYCGKNLKPTCPACGKTVDQSWKACPACGATIDPGQPRQA
jgi:hypothetical protein